jgi:ankyrin repeat protein
LFTLAPTSKILDGAAPKTLRFAPQPNMSFAHCSSSTNTPLYLACRSAATAASAAARLLILAGADVNSRSFGLCTDVSYNETPLHAAAEVLVSSCSATAVAASASDDKTECGRVLEHNEVTWSFGRVTLCC